MARPDKLRIALEEEGLRFDRVGRLPDGSQFMGIVIGAAPANYDPKTDFRSQKQWQAVLHRFDAEGNHIGTEARLGGFDSEGRDVAGDEAYALLETMLAERAAGGKYELCDIWVKLFEVGVGDYAHGLVYEESTDEPEEGEERDEWVHLVPWGVQFLPPWDRSEYDT